MSKSWRLRYADSKQRVSAHGNEGMRKCHHMVTFIYSGWEVEISPGLSVTCKADLFHTTRQVQRHSQATLTQVLQLHLATMTVSDVACDPQTQPISLQMFTR